MSRSRVSPPPKGPDTPAERGAVRFVDNEAHAPAGLHEALRKKPRAIPEATSGRRAGSVPAEERADAESPRAIRIVLTGQASPGAATGAIDDGEVCLCLARPSNPVGPACGIQCGLRLRDPGRESSRRPSMARQRQAMPRQLELRRPGIGEVKVNGRARRFPGRRLPGTSLAGSNRRTDGGV